MKDDSSFSFILLYIHGDVNSQTRVTHEIHDLQAPNWSRVGAYRDNKARGKGQEAKRFYITRKHSLMDKNYEVFLLLHWERHHERGGWLRAPPPHYPTTTDLYIQCTIKQSTTRGLLSKIIQKLVLVLQHLIYFYYISIICLLFKYIFGDISINLGKGQSKPLNLGYRNAYYMGTHKMNAYEKL